LTFYLHMCTAPDACLIVYHQGTELLFVEALYEHRYEYGLT